jgi:hypothetical protein
MIQPRAADDFALIRARMKELRRVRERAEAAESQVTVWIHRRAPPELDIGRSERSNCAGTDLTIWVDMNRVTR